MSFSKKAVGVLVAVGLALVLLAGFLLQKPLLSHLPSLQSSPGSDLPQIEVVINHPQLGTKSSPSLKQATKLLFEALGYETNWHYFYLPQPQLAHQALMPQVIKFEFLPISAYQPENKQKLYAPIVIEGVTYRGFVCQPEQDDTLLHCWLYISDKRFETTNTSETTSYLTYEIYNTLMVLSKQSIEGETAAQRWQALEAQLQAHQATFFVITSSPTSLLFQLKSALATVFNHLAPPAWAQTSYCEGDLECKVKVFYYLCLNDGTTRCTLNGELDPLCGYTTCGTTQYSECTGPWELQEHSWCHANSWLPYCPDPMGGTCEEDSPVFCRTRGICYPVGGTTPPPLLTPSATPPPGSTPVPTNPPSHDSCGCCDSSDWNDVDNQCFERNGRPGLQCCCGTGSCERLTDGGCLDNPIECPNINPYWITPISGHVYNAQTNEPVANVGVKVYAEVYVAAPDVYNYYDLTLTTDANGEFRTGTQSYDAEGKPNGCASGICFDWGCKDVFFETSIISYPAGFIQDSALTMSNTLRGWPNQGGGAWEVCDDDNNCHIYGYNACPSDEDCVEYAYYQEPINKNHCESPEATKDIPTAHIGQRANYCCQSMLWSHYNQQNFSIEPIRSPVVLDVSLEEPSSGEACIADQSVATLIIRSVYNDKTVNPTYDNDIRDFQVNIENQSVPTEGLPTYDPNLWPIRLMVSREEGSFANLYRLYHGPSNTTVSAPFVYDSNEDIYYLTTDLSINNIATLRGADSAEEAKTYFQIIDRNINAYWELNLLNNFPSTSPVMTDFHLNGFVADFENNQHILALSGFSSPLVVNASGTNYYFHRRANLTTTTPAINLSYFESDSNENVNADGVCENTTSSPPSIGIDRIPGAHLRIKPAEGDDNTWENYDISTYQELEVCGDFDIELNLDPADGFICICGTGFDNFTCHYENVPSTYADGDPSINFYLLPVDLTHDAWIQAVGGQLIAQTGINSIIPFDGATGGPCHPYQSCWPALVSWSPWPNGNVNTPGFVYAGSSINTGNDSLSLIHSPSGISEQRNQSYLGNARSNDLFPTQYNYQYFFNRLGHLAQPFFSSNMPNIQSDNNLSVWLYQPASPGDPLVINETNNWVLNDRQKAVIFVDGDLRIEDSTPDTPDQIITVPNAQNYLAFIVSGVIEIAPSVGYNIPSGLPQAFALPNDVLANVEGIFLSDQTITVESLDNPDVADKKFIGAGTFVGWNGVNLERSFSDNGIGQAWHNYNPTETFIYRPDFLVNAPLLMKEAVHEWREVAPKTIE